MTDFFEMMMSGSGLDGYKPRSALDLLISDKLTPDQNKAVQSRGRLGLAKGLLAMSGPSTTPVSFGQAFASGIDQMQQARAGAVDEMLKGAQIENLTDDGEVDEDIQVYMTEDDPDTNFDETKRKTIIKRSQYDPKLHRLELEEVENKTLKVYPLVDDKTTEIDETQTATYIEPSKFDETKYSAEAGYLSPYKLAKQEAIELYPKNPTLQKEHIVKKVGGINEKDREILDQKIQINDQQIFINGLNNQFAKEINELEIDNKKLHNAGLELSNKHQEVVNSNQGAIAELDIESKQLANLKSQVELETLPDIKEAELVNLKTNIEATRQKIAFDDNANILKLDKMSLEIDGLNLKNEATKLDIDNAPTVNKLANELAQLNILDKQIELEFKPDQLQENLDNIKLRNEELAKTIDFNDENNVLLLATNNAKLKEIQYKIDNPKVDWEQITTEQKFRKEFNALPQVDSVIESNKFYNEITELVASQQTNPDGPADIAILFNYMKMIDPESVVRESEGLMLQDASNLPDSLVARWKHITSTGETLPNNVRLNVQKATKVIMAQRVKTYDTLYDQYSKIATDSGFDVDRTMPKLQFELFTTIEY
jgi:hypothetical protein